MTGSVIKARVEKAPPPIVITAGHHLLTIVETIPIFAASEKPPKIPTDLSHQDVDGANFMR